MLGTRPIAGLCFALLLFTAFQPAAAQSRVSELNEAAWKALQKGDPDRAARYFAEALTLSPNDPVLLLGAGASAHTQGRQRDAMARLQRALEIDPKLTQA